MHPQIADIASTAPGRAVNAGHDLMICIAQEYRQQLTIGDAGGGYVESDDLVAQELDVFGMRVGFDVIEGHKI